MARLTAVEKKEALENALRSFGFDEKYCIQQADGRIGQKFAIAEKNENGGISTYTDYKTFEELNNYLMGYSRALNHPFK